MTIKWEIRLPTEWEWQWAASGSNLGKPYYPWGNSGKERLANTAASGLRTATAVGMYPAGATAEGVLDMAGNAKEPCLNEFDNPENVGIEGEEKRAYRGGNFDTLESDMYSQAKTSCRDSGFYGGLRLIVATTPNR